MESMKKTKKNNQGPIPKAGNSKGQKLSYDNLRVVVMDTISRNKTQPWSARQLLKKLKIANNKSDVARVLESLVKQGKLTTSEPGIYTSLMAPKVSGEKIKAVKAVGNNVKTGTVGS